MKDDLTGYGEKEDREDPPSSLTLRTEPLVTIYASEAKGLIVLMNDSPIGTLYPPNKEASEWLTTLLKGKLKLPKDPSEFSQSSK